MDIFEVLSWLSTILNNILKYGSHLFSFFSSLLETGISHLNAGNVTIAVLIFIILLKIIHNIK